MCQPLRIPLTCNILQDKATIFSGKEASEDFGRPRNATVPAQKNKTANKQMHSMNFGARKMSYVASRMAR